VRVQGENISFEKEPRALSQGRMKMNETQKISAFSFFNLYYLYSMNQTFFTSPSLLIILY
jgi:hypothetical protein